MYWNVCQRYSHIGYNGEWYMVVGMYVVYGSYYVLVAFDNGVKTFLKLCLKLNCNGGYAIGRVGLLDGSGWHRSLPYVL